MMFTGTLFDLKITGRILAKGKTFTLINLTGLVLGLTAAFILLSFAINELSYNKGFKNSNQIYRVIVRDMKGTKSGFVPFLMKDLFSSAYPQIEKSSRIIKSDFFVGNLKVKTNPTLIPVNNFYCVDPEFIDIFSLSITPEAGSRMLHEQNTVLISEKFRKRIFGNENPVGKSVTFRMDGDSYPLIVQGVFQDFNWDASFKPEVLGSISLFNERMKNLYPDSEKEFSSGNDFSAGLFLLINKYTSPNEVVKKIPSVISNSIFKKTGLGVTIQKFSQSYFNSEDIHNDFVIKGNKSNLLIYISLAGFILILAGINYSMLSTARSALRFKEIGIRKVLGANKSNLRSQILTESFLLTLLALPLTFLLIGLINPLFGVFFGAEIQLHISNLWISVVLFTVIIFLIAFLSGIYIAMYLSSLDVLTALKSNYYLYKKVTLGKLLIVVQLFITISLFIGLIVIFLQLHLLYNQNVGVQKENLMMLDLQPEEFMKSSTLEEQLRQNPEILNSAQVSIAIPTIARASYNIKIPGQPNKKISIEVFKAGPGFFKTMGIGIVKGRDFRMTDTAFKTPPVVINEEAAQLLSIKDPLYKKIGPYQIVGITRNFNIRTLHNRVSPTMVIFGKEPGKTLVLRYKAGREEQMLAVISDQWSKLAPELNMEYKFFDKELNLLYSKEQKFGLAIGMFTGIAFGITGMGLFGLALLMAERRRKEISVRKIFGATYGHIILLLQKEFLIYFMIAAIASVPVSWYLLSLWLQGFYYHISLTWIIFAGAILVAGCFVSLILLWKSLGVLNENPANALKYE